MEQVKVTVFVTEIVECSKDCWDQKSESHYTKDWDEEQENKYTITVNMDEDGNILDSKKELESKVNAVCGGEVISFEVDG
jgi:hypothetical protein